VVGYVLFAFAGSLPLLFASRIIDGITGGNIGTAQAVIADVTTGSERARGMGLIGMAFGLGFIFGPAIGGFSVHFGRSAPGLVAASLSFAALLFAYFRLPETRPVGAAARPFEILSIASVLRTARRPGIGALLVVALLAAVAFANFESTFSQYLKARFGFGPSSVAWVFVVIGVTSALVQGGLIRRLVPKYGEARIIVAGLVCLAAGFALLAFGSGYGALLPAIVLMSLGTGLSNPALMGFVSRRTPPTEQGEVLGSLQSMSALGRIAGPFWGETVFLRVGHTGPHVTGLVLESAALALGASRLLRAPAPDPHAPPASPGA
jgi:predicted MFS family arabinose efflux permease